LWEGEVRLTDRVEPIDRDEGSKKAIDATEVTMTSKPKLSEELEANARSLAKRASEKEKERRERRGLTKQMNQKSNARAMKRASNPKEPKGAAKYRRYQDRKLGKMGAASKVRHIDPATGKSVMHKRQPKALNDRESTQK